MRGAGRAGLSGRFCQTGGSRRKSVMRQDGAVVSPTPPPYPGVPPMPPKKPRPSGWWFAVGGFLLVAAVLAYPFNWRTRLTGLVLGTLLVHALNQGRLLLLWHAFRHDRALFGLLHGTVLPLIMVAFCLLGFLWFAARHGTRPA